MKKWYAIGTQSGIQCLNCDESIRKVGYIHTNTGVCPNCKIPSIFYDAGNKIVIQIVPDNTPKSFKKFIDWFQTELNEIEFLELFGSFRRIGKAANIVYKEESNK